LPEKSGPADEAAPVERARLTGLLVRTDLLWAATGA